MKKSLPLLGFILLTNLASAYNSYSSYTNFSLGDLLRSFDLQDVTIFAVLLLVWMLVSFSLKRVFPPKFANVIGGIFGILAAWGIVQMEIDLSTQLSEILYKIGLPEDINFWAIPISIILVLGFMIYKITLSGTLMLIGAGLFFISFTDLFYEKGAAMFLGIISFILGVVVMKIKQRMNWGNKKWSSILVGLGILSWVLGFATDQNTTGGFIGTLMIFIGLLGIIGKERVEDSWYRTKQIRGEQLKNFGRWAGRKAEITYQKAYKGPQMNRAYEEERIKKKQELIQSKRGMQVLIYEAKQYKAWADSQSNPGFLKNWAKFIGYLKQKGYGSSEADICQRLYVQPGILRRIVKRYILSS